MVHPADLCLATLNHLRVDLMPYTGERKSKLVQIPPGRRLAELVKICSSRWHCRTMAVGKTGDDTGMDLPHGPFDDDVGEGWGLAPVLAEDLTK